MKKTRKKKYTHVKSEVVTKFVVMPTFGTIAYAAMKSGKEEFPFILKVEPYKAESHKEAVIRTLEKAHKKLYAMISKFGDGTAYLLTKGRKTSVMFTNY